MTPNARLRLARRHAGLSQMALADALGVQRSAVSHWESMYDKHPRTVHLRQIALITEVQFEWLATGRGRMVLDSDTRLDSIAAADALLVEDQLEIRLLQAFREATTRSRIAVVEIVEQLAQRRTGRMPHTDP